MYLAGKAYACSMTDKPHYLKESPKYSDLGGGSFAKSIWWQA